MSHKCHAYKCTKEVPPKMFMCLKHWKLVPAQMQRDIWRHYKPGQEIRKDPTSEYLKASQRAIFCVIIRESGVAEKDIPEVLERMNPEPQPTPREETEG